MNKLWMVSLLLLAGCQQGQPTAIDLGDSTSLAYAAYARENLYHTVDFRHDPWSNGDIVPENDEAYISEEVDASVNDGYSGTLLETLDTRMANTGDHYNVVAFNSGYHDLQHDPEDVGAVRTSPSLYRENLEAIAQILEAHADVVIWVDTPGLDSATAQVGGPVVNNDMIPVYNAIAESVAREHGFYILNMPSTGHLPDDVHFTLYGYKILGGFLSDCVMTALSQQQTDSCHK